MRSILLSSIAIILFASCAQTQGSKINPDTKEAAESKIFTGTKKASSEGEAVASFAEGCFWHTEIVFQSLEGVRDAVSGYAGGFDTSPDYDKVCTGETGHAETVNVYYDPRKISFATLVKAFFASHDPTQLNRQGNDEGSQYRSIAFYRNQEEKNIIDAEIKRLTDAKKYNEAIVTEVKPFDKFYPAEDYHQEYISEHPNNTYVAYVSIPDYKKFRREFKDGKFKQ
jgi:peptide-methionine (S)-S-oxide reductase